MRIPSNNSKPLNEDIEVLNAAARESEATIARNVAEILEAWRTDRVHAGMGETGNVPVAGGSLPPG